MRTEKQYGYVVMNKPNLLAKESSFDFIIQSGTHSLDEIVRTSDEFIQSHLTALKPRLEQMIPSIKQSLERSNIVDDINMTSAFERYDNYIFKRGENPNYLEDLKTEIQNLTTQDLTSYIDTYFLSPQRSTLTVIHVGEGFKGMDIRTDETVIKGLSW